MKCAEMINFLSLPRSSARMPVRMPNGLLGFEEIKDYVLTTNPDQQPFGWLKVLRQCVPWRLWCWTRSSPCRITSPTYRSRMWNF